MCTPSLDVGEVFLPKQEVSELGDRVWAASQRNEYVVVESVA